MTADLTLHYHLWLFFRYLLITVIVLFFIGGIDDIILDFSFYLRHFFRKIFKRKIIKPLALSQIRSIPEKPIAIMIPAWNERNVIRKMLLNTISTIDYKNYYLFVGTYPNDPATLRELEKVGEFHHNLVPVVVSNDGPTNKADCLNDIYNNILKFEEQNDVSFEIFAMHDAEDIIHPLTLKMFNYLMPRIKMVQIPVLALEVSWHNFVGGVYMDEFAELHLKNLRSRELLTNTVPSAGVGTGFSRSSLEDLNKRYSFVFNKGSMAEDYEMSMTRLRNLGTSQIILHHFISRVITKKTLFGKREKQVKVNDIVATREFFPTKFWKAVGQRTRWNYGIVFQGWRHLKWTRNLRINYSLYQDRKAVPANIVVFLGYVVFCYWLIISAIKHFDPDFLLPPAS